MALLLPSHARPASSPNPPNVNKYPLPPSLTWLLNQARGRQEARQAGARLRIPAEPGAGAVVRAEPGIAAAHQEGGAHGGHDPHGQVGAEQWNPPPDRIVGAE